MQPPYGCSIELPLHGGDYLDKHKIGASLFHTDD
jgi:hypothetical protein